MFCTGGTASACRPSPSSSAPPAPQHYLLCHYYIALPPPLHQPRRSSTCSATSSSPPEPDSLPARRRLCRPPAPPLQRRPAAAAVPLPCLPPRTLSPEAVGVSHDSYRAPVLTREYNQHGAAAVPLLPHCLTPVTTRIVHRRRTSTASKSTRFGLRKVARFFPVQSVTSLVGVHTCRIMLDGGPRALLRVLTAPSKVIKFVV